MAGSLDVAFQGARPAAFHTTCILIPCINGWNLGAGVLDCRQLPTAAKFVRDDTGILRKSLDTGLLCVDDVWLQDLPGRWWMAGQTCMRCPHGFVGSGTLIFAGACFLPKCVLEVAETTRRAAVADILLADPAFLSSFVATLSMLIKDPFLRPYLENFRDWSSSPSPTLKSVASAFASIISLPGFSLSSIHHS